MGSRRRWTTQLTTSLVLPHLGWTWGAGDLWMALAQRSLVAEGPLGFVVVSRVAAFRGFGSSVLLSSLLVVYFSYPSSPY